jgi:lipooligosaccharide transport system permease protein
MVCSSAMNTASFEGLYSAFTRMDVQKTWDAMLATPLSVPDIVIGEALWAATKGLISSVAIMVVAALLGTVADGWALLALPVIFLTGLCFAAMALVVTACAKNYDFFMYYYTLLMTPMMLLSSIFFPLQEMPPVIQWLAWLLPLIHAVDLVRPLMTGLPLEQPGLHLLVLVGYSAAFLALAIRLCQRRLLA